MKSLEARRMKNARKKERKNRSQKQLNVTNVHNAWENIEKFKHDLISIIYFAGYGMDYIHSSTAYICSKMRH